jgi:hypothetical protein
MLSVPTDVDRNTNVFNNVNSKKKIEEPHASIIRIVEDWNNGFL